MIRVASLYLPQLPIERLRRLERSAARPKPAGLSIRPRFAEPIDDNPGACSVPRGGGWRPGARWARDNTQRPGQSEIDALPAHQRPTMREMGRRSESAEHPFKAMPADEGGASTRSAPGLTWTTLWGRPTILIARTGQRDVVTAVCPVALELGLRSGMAAAHAHALVSDLEVHDADPDADRAWLERLASHAVGHWTPTACVAGTDGLWLDLTGATHLFGGEARFCRRLLRFLERLGFTASIAIAGTPGAAHALARYSGTAITLLPSGTETQAIADLPLAALRLDPEALVSAARFGLERIADLYPMPRGPLAKRLGLATVRRLDQARGMVAEPIVPVVPFEAPRVERRLLEPIGTAEAITQVIGDLVDDLVNILQRRGLGLRTAHLSCLIVDGSEQRLAIGTARAILYHTPEARPLQDVMAAIRERTTIDGLGFKRERYMDRNLKSPEEMERRFTAFPDAIEASAEIADQCRFDLGEIQYQYPYEQVMDGRTAQQALAELTQAAAARMFPAGLPTAYARQIDHELRLIDQLGYAPYFLTVNAIVAESRRRGILCQGRGSAANSCVCYMLGITSIDPIQHELLFERFVSGERKEPPDIDVDFEHERREEIIQWIYETYGRTRSALTAVVTRYRTRGAVAEVGKALGLPRDLTKMLTGLVWGWSMDGIADEQIESLNLNAEDHRLKLTLELSRQLIGSPRHLSQHPGGFVLTQDRLDDLVPIEPARMEDRQIIEWDKDDIDALKFMKVDVLGLGMLGCMNRAFNLLEEHKGIRVGMADLQDDDPQVYAMIQRADTLGVFQIESRAQMSMLPRIKPNRFYDLVIEVAIVRPGPIQGDMVHPYLRRREGKEKPEYPKPELRAVLEKTLGVPLFQEQAMKVAIVGAGFTPAEADQLRRAMATFKLTGGVSHFYDKLVNGMVSRGYPKDFNDMRIVRCADLRSIRDGRNVEVAGVILVRQRPGSAKGVLFVTIEDETGVANGVLWPNRFEIYRRQVMSASMIAMRGRLQKEGEIIHIICDRITDHDDMLRSIGRMDFAVAPGRGDGARHGGGPDPRDPAFPNGRTLASPPYNAHDIREEVVPIRSHDLH